MNDFIQSLKESFLGRICTILTQPVSFTFKDAMQHAQFFTGRVEVIDNHGIWLRHLHTDTIAFYQFPIVGIVEEQVVPQSDPRAAKIAEEIKKKESKPTGMPPPNQQFIPIDSLTNMVKNTKKKL